MALVNTDIYNIRNSIQELQNEYIPESEETLSLGIFGFMGDLESKKIQTAIMMVGELENEVFPNRAKLDKNIVTHAIMQNIENINATPSYITVVIGITTDDLDRYMVNGRFTFDKDCPFIITNENTDIDYEYHLDYDIILSQSTNANTKVYAAVYDIDRPNNISQLDNPYLTQPHTIKMNDRTYVFFQCTLHQVSIVNNYNQLVNGSIIDNKTLTVEFEDQLADFDVKVTENGVETYLTPIFEGASIDSDIEYYCYYTYITSNMIRIKFDRTSYMPGLNAEVEVILKTTKGTEGIFNYSDTFYTVFRSDKYSYDNITLLVMPNTNSTGGVDRKSVEELQSIIPKETLSRGCITTETDLTNYFNLINTSENRMEIVKKADNQIERTYYGYFVLKNSEGNIVPTNTIDLLINVSDFSVYEDNGTYVLPAGTMIEFDPNTFVGKVVKESESEYLYSTLYTTIVNVNPLYSAFYMTIVNEDPYLSFEYINQDSELQFISENIHFERRLVADRDKYRISFDTTQNINVDLFAVGNDLTEQEYIDNLKEIVKACIVLYKDGVPYRYKFAELTGFDPDLYRYTFEFEFDTDNMFDLSNNIKILDLNIAGSEGTNYGYMNDSTEAHIYIISKFGTEYGRHDLDDIVPGLDGFTVANEYEIYNGLNFFKNYSNLTNCRVIANVNEDETIESYSISGVPVLGYDYTRDEDHVFDFIQEMNYKKLYIDNALNVLENSFEIDFKLFNTYGPSRTYTTDEAGNNSIGRIDVVINFKLSLKSSSDVYTKDAIIVDVKDYIENIEDTDDLHIPNLTSYIREKYINTINYFEYLGFNGFDANTQHMYKQELDNKFICPEFINVRNTLDVDGNIVPEISIETVAG